MPESECPRCGHDLSPCWHSDSKGWEPGMQHCAWCMWHTGQPVHEDLWKEFGPNA